MKINEVEQLVGISRKNIRFYEDQSLIHPGRNASNGYRDYTEADVMRLRKIRFLRKLAVPIEEIRKLFEGEKGFSSCMEDHLIRLHHEYRNLEVIMDVCESLKAEEESIDALDAENWLGKIAELEKGGSIFMDVEKIDQRKMKRGAVIAAAVMIGLILAWDILILSLNAYDPAPLLAIILITVLPSLVIVGIVIALMERLKEIEGGELDEASKY